MWLHCGFWPIRICRLQLRDLSGKKLMRYEHANALRSATFMNNLKCDFFAAVLVAVSMSMLGCQSTSQNASSSGSLPKPTPPSVSSSSSSSSGSMSSSSASTSGSPSQTGIPAARQAQNGGASAPASLPQINQGGQRRGAESQPSRREATQPSIQNGDMGQDNDGNISISGVDSVNSDPKESNSGDYTLDRLPGLDTGGGNVVVNSGRDSQGGAMTSSERAAILDRELQRGYEEFDGFILGERERAQSRNNAIGPSGSQASSGGGQGLPQTLPQVSAGAADVEPLSRPVSSEPRSTETFAPPADIPSGRDDDVVARQLREAAMAESDPELREALWDEYRNYTGLGIDN